ncbi:hypothetical protein O53_14 [Microcystis aeruginosa TAIHU98]|uniref:Uncharacterized protein n=2 Tax=Microcystis aeruginosa TaxID=1126 RepID=L7EAU7_MICAE|nr:hypothetical protein BH695_1796 [Microcystis aeruginosa PCC 7806SL]ELP55417.1 hypothetical protein O53_14 [Microcystis aeruginosa TAIHU98]ELS49897.1 hypothetical protein C789_296 [Microcystis aeruginosa FACHB-905 = DIANCHI905]ODV39540.1 hypothetical protein BFG60_0824 [Microcystis aeruginosa NIES-98]
MFPQLKTDLVSESIGGGIPVLAEKLRSAFSEFSLDGY